jgi:lipid II:glycine glycyltransferase (peptidoglycan interpeptide bridge formation enzyme)
VTGSPGAAATSTAASLRDDPAAWDAFVAETELGHFIQLSAWAEILAARGWQPVRIVADSPDGPIGAQVLVRRMRYLPWAQAYAWRGPIARSYSEAAIEAFTAAVRDAARRGRWTHLFIDAELPAGGDVAARLLRSGWQRTRWIQPSRTRVIDLRQSEEELRSGLDGTARNLTNKSRKLGVTVAVEGEAGLAEFEALHDATVARLGIRRRDVVAAYRAFAPRDGVLLLIERDPDGTAVSGVLIVSCGRRAYELYNGSVREGPAASVVNYQIHWQALVETRNRGFESYDMFGTDQPNLATFKAHFGGEERVFEGGFELVTSPIGRLALRLVRRAWGILRRQPTGEPGA